MQRYCERCRTSLLLRVQLQLHLGGVLLKGPIIAMLRGCNNFASCS